MNYRWLSLLAIVTLTACGVGATPNSPTTDEADGAADTVINPTAGLNAYPGASNNEVIPDGVDSRTRFSSDASMQVVYSYFDGQLTAQGWVQTSTEAEDDEVEAEYTCEGRELELEDGSFELEIDIDGDNASYDEDNGAGDDDSGDDEGDDGTGDDDGNDS